MDQLLDTLLVPGIYEITDINLKLKSLLPNKVKLKVTIGDIRLKSNLSSHKTKKFRKNSFFYTISGFTQSHLGPLGDIEGFIRKLPGTIKSKKPINNTGIDEIHLKYDCISGSIVIGIRKPISYSFAFNSPPAHKIKKEPRIKLFKKINEPVLSHFIFYLEDDDYKAVSFNGETISFTRQLNKI